MAAAIIRQAVLLVVTPQCFEEFFTEMNFFHVPCLKATVSKGLGLGIIVGSILVKVPQIVKILKNKSAEGLSFTGNSLELVAVINSFCYNFMKQYPFSSYGDSVFLLIQTAAIAALILHYGGASEKALAFLALVAASVAVLCSGSLPMTILTALQVTNIPIVFVGKMMQVWANFCQGSTGQLSAVTIFLLTAGSAARIFTSIQETGDSIIILSYCVATFANSCLFGQLLYYWNVPQAKKNN